MPTIGVFVPINSDQDLMKPEERPVGRAALSLMDRGIVTIFGDQITAQTNGQIEMTGLCAHPGVWRPITKPISAMHDRYPSQRRSKHHKSVQRKLGATPLANPISVTSLCRDKLSCQRFLERQGIVMPPVEDDPKHFQARLTEWGSGFIKPRYGALGTGVRSVQAHDTLPARIEGVVPGVLEPPILQRSVPAPDGWAGRAVRTLVQRTSVASWHFCESVVRQSRTDLVVNAARGAQVRCGSDALSDATRSEISCLSQRICAAFETHPDGQWIVELGLDFMIDPEGHPQLIEVNSRPRGRLEVLATLHPSRFVDDHVRACGRPLEYLASLTATP